MKCSRILIYSTVLTYPVCLIFLFQWWRTLSEVDWQKLRWMWWLLGHLEVGQEKLVWIQVLCQDKKTKLNEAQMKARIYFLNLFLWNSLLVLLHFCIALGPLKLYPPLLAPRDDCPLLQKGGYSYRDSFFHVLMFLYYFKNVKTEEQLQSCFKFMRQASVYAAMTLYLNGKTSACRLWKSE